MRTAYKVWSGIAAAVFCVVAIIVVSNNAGTSPAGGTGTSTRAAGATPSPPSTDVTTPSQSVVPTVAAPTTPTSAGELVTVTKVIDGDSLEVTGGRQVRFLGIDACEMSTEGGRKAKEYLQIFTGVGEQVRLIADGARDLDRYDRLLRRVERDTGSTSPYDPYSNDIGMTIIGHPAIGIYGGKNDADATYLATLRENDVGERDCSGAAGRPG